MGPILVMTYEALSQNQPTNTNPSSTRREEWEERMKEACMVQKNLASKSKKVHGYKDSDERFATKIKLLKYIDIVNELHKDLSPGVFNVESPTIIREKDIS